MQGYIGYITSNNNDEICAKLFTNKFNQISGIRETILRSFPVITIPRRICNRKLTSKIDLKLILHIFNYMGDCFNQIPSSFHHHFGYFYSTSSSPLLLRGAPDYSIDTVSELTRRSATGNCE